MELKLIIDGEEKVFKQPDAVLALRVKQSLNFITDIEKDFDPRKFELIVNFIANDLYEGAFTPEQFWSGMDASELVNNIRDCLSVPFNKMYSAMEPLKN
ncbi:hypothetical protein PDK35_02390 [Bacillus cereus group sp. TH153LC]|uniref:phage tail assembly chaperone G n=1 Tax=Bacillus cereus group sp. TH153LC TaxID=3018059 RepID=UPI0022E77911|nr:hypothetical protein [Bacillus cereus group sp. TH153LC]MDA1658824.1 hypothetical protein [Bacillus cereus group sp. TH153LC]